MDKTATKEEVMSFLSKCSEDTAKINSYLGLVPLKDYIGLEKYATNDLEKINLRVLGETPIFRKEKEMKEIPSDNLKRIVIHSRDLEKYLKLGMKITKIHRVLEFDQSPLREKKVNNHRRKKTPKNKTPVNKTPVNKTPEDDKEWQKNSNIIPDDFDERIKLYLKNKN